jgi:hypothetical protein
MEEGFLDGYGSFLKIIGTLAEAILQWFYTMK